MRSDLSWPWPAFLAVAFATPSLRSQLTHTASAANTMTCLAQPNIGSIAAGASLSPSNSMTASFVFGTTTLMASGSYQTSTTVLGPHFSLTEAGTRISLVPAGLVSTGPNESLWIIHTTQSVTGILSVVGTTVSGFASNTASASVDIGDDGSIEWTLAGGSRLSRFVSFANSLTVRVRTQTNVAFWQQTLQVDLQFEPLALIHDNGPLVTHAGAGAGGADASAVQDVPPLLLSEDGYPADANAASSDLLADQFHVCAAPGWTVAAIGVTAFVPGAPAAPSPLDGLFVAIYDGDPSGGGQPVAGGPDLATNLMTAGAVLRNEWSRSYRTRWNDIATSTSRALQELIVELPAPVALPPGTYWLVWQMTAGTASPGPFVPPVTVVDKRATGDALRRSNGVFSAVVSGPSAAPQALPFRLYGIRSDPIGSFTVTSPGCGGAGLALAGAPNIGGFLRAELTNTTPGTIPLLGLDLVGANISVCGCVVGHTFSLLLAGAQWELDVPNNVALCGADVFVQGLEFGVGACPTLPFRLTETIHATIR